MEKGDPRAKAGAAATNAIRRWTRDNRRETVALFLACRPNLSTDEIAETLGVDRSTIRRDRRALRLDTERARG